MTGKESGKNSTSKLHYIKPHIEKRENSHSSCRQYKIKLRKIYIVETRDWELNNIKGDIEIILGSRTVK